ncbi:hypothetical protein ACFPM7_23170 [Actinokineospora guangxiensis]|uniref:Thiopeptide-type bacteriocin biosynthesis domain-containing protein n=1 Tax=Actinokineospora guangxiensis TaxID=1490288 RepID=A0ABW0EU87_9PSEU
MYDVVCYYHESRKAPLLRRALLPAVRELAGAGVPAHIERHWLGGPHAVLRVAAEREVAETAAAALRDHLAEHPSTTVLDPDALLRQAEELGRRELIPGPYSPIHPDNTVIVRPSDFSALTALLGTERAVAERSALLRLGMEPVATTVDYLARNGDSSGARVTATIAAMAAHAANYPSGIGAGYQSMLSHVEDHLAFADPDGALRAGFERAGAALGDGPAELVAAIADGDDGPADLAPVIAAWRGWTTAASAHADAALDTAELVGSRNGHAGVAAGFGGETELRWDFTRRSVYSAYHDALNRSGFEQIAMERKFGVYRFGTNVLYRLLALYDLVPVERYLAAHVFSAATEKVVGRTWQELLGVAR